MPRKAKPIIEYRIYDLEPDFPVQMHEGDNWLISNVLSGRQHFHNCLEIGVCHENSGTLYYGKEKQAFRAGDVSCIAHHVLHTTCSQRQGPLSRWSYLFVAPDGLLGRELYETVSPTTDALLDAHLLVNRDECPRVYELTLAIIEELRLKRKDYRAAVKSLFFVLYRELAFLAEGRSTDQAPGRGYSFALQPALNHIHDGYMNPLTIGRLSEMCHLSPTHFRRTFTATMGMPPLSFLNATRIHHACELLLTTSDSVLAVSEKVGFASISSFNRSFLQLTGVSPRAYRSLSARREALPRGENVLQYKGWTKAEAFPAEPSPEQPQQ